MNDIGTLISQRKPVIGSERSNVIKDIYALYTSITERKLRKIANWSNYCEWCKKNKEKDSELNRIAFRRSHHFIKEQNIKEFCIFLAPFDIDALYYMLSISMDKNKREKSVGAYIYSLRKK